jgi:hypothetical protein
MDLRMFKLKLRLLRSLPGTLLPHKIIYTPWKLLLERFLERPGLSLVRFERCFRKKLSKCLVFIRIEESASKNQDLDPQRMPNGEYATPHLRLGIK